MQMFLLILKWFSKKIAADECQELVPQVQKYIMIRN